MAWDKLDDGTPIAFPRIVKKDGKLQELKAEDAYNYAIKTGEYKTFKDKSEAEKYADGGYKNGTPLEDYDKFLSEASLPKVNTSPDISIKADSNTQGVASIETAPEEKKSYQKKVESDHKKDVENFADWVTTGQTKEPLTLSESFRSPLALATKAGKTVTDYVKGISEGIDSGVNDFNRARELYNEQDAVTGNLKMLNGTTKIVFGAMQMFAPGVMMAVNTALEGVKETAPEDVNKVLFDSGQVILNKLEPDESKQTERQKTEAELFSTAAQIFFLETGKIIKSGVPMPKAEAKLYAKTLIEANPETVQEATNIVADNNGEFNPEFPKYTVSQQELHSKINSLKIGLENPDLSEQTKALYQGELSKAHEALQKTKADEANVTAIDGEIGGYKADLEKAADGVEKDVIQNKIAELEKSKNELLPSLEEIKTLETPQLTDTRTDIISNQSEIGNSEDTTNVQKSDVENKGTTLAENTNDVDFTKKLIDQGLFNSAGQLQEQRIDFGMPTEEIKRGVEDIKNGKDSAAARKIFEKTKEIRDSGTIPMIQGTGGTSIKGDVSLEEWDQQNPHEPTINDVPPTPPKEIKVRSSVFESEAGKKSLLNRAYEGVTDKDVKASLEKHGLNYEVESHKEARASAKQFIKDVGNENALEAIRTNKIEGAPAAFVWSELIDDVGSRISGAKNEAELNELTDLQTKLVSEFSDKGKFKGRFISALNDIYQNSDLGYKYEKQVEQYKAGNNGVLPPDIEAKFKEYDSQIAEINKKLKEAEEIAKKAEEQKTITDIQESISRKKKEQNIKEISKGIAAKIRKGKINRPDVFSSATPGSIVWDGAIEVAARTVEAGGTIAQAVIDGIGHIKESEWYKSLDKEKQNKAEEAYRKNIEEQDAEKIESGKIKVPKSLIRDLVEGGIDNIEDLTKAVKEAIKEEYPDASDREVRDAITNYGKTINMSSDEIDIQLRKMRRMGRLISGIEDAQEKKRPLRSGLQRDKLDVEERAKKRELELLLRDLPFSEGEMDLKQKSSLDALKTRTQNAIEDLELKLKNKDYSKNVKKPIISDSELTKLKAQKINIQEKFNKAQYENELKNRTTTTKVIDGLKEGFNLTRTLMASLDFSAVLVQNAIGFVSRPIQSSRSFVEQFKHFGSEQYHTDWMNKFKTTPLYDEIQLSKGYLAKENVKMSAREEQFVSGWINHFWDGIGKYTFGLANKKAFEVWKKLNPYKATERAYTGYLNSIRVQRFAEGFDQLKREGKTFESNQEEFKSFASYVNNATGRGNLGGLEKSAKALQIAFFSPRKIASRINLINPVYYAKLAPEARKMAMKDFITFLGVTGCAVLLAKQGGAKVETDPRSSNFMKIQIGNTFIDFFGGFQQEAVLIAREIMGETKNSKGKIEELGSKKGIHEVDTRFDKLLQFFVNKAAPVPAVAIKFGQSHLDKHKDRVSKFGERMELQDEILANTTPLWTQDLKTLYEEHDPAVATGLSILSLFGGGVQDYTKPQKK